MNRSRTDEIEIEMVRQNHMRAEKIYVMEICQTKLSRIGGAL